VRHFGNWLRVSAEFAEGSALRVLVTLHLKGWARDPWRCDGPSPAACLVRPRKGRA
jgi:hypothetical protein